MEKRLSFAAKLEEVMDFPVANGHVATICGQHGLIAAWPGIDDREAPVAKRDASIGADQIPSPWATRCANKVIQARRPRRLNCAAAKIDDAGNSAHA